MPARLGFVQGAVLALLPTAAFFVGPTLALFLPDDFAGVFVYSVLPTVLPIGALAFVGVFTYHRTRRVLVAVGLTALALLLAAIGALAFLVAVWPTEN